MLHCAPDQDWNPGGSNLAETSNGPFAFRRPASSHSHLHTFTLRHNKRYFREVTRSSPFFELLAYTSSTCQHLSLKPMTRSWHPWRRCCALTRTGRGLTSKCLVKQDIHLATPTYYLNLQANTLSPHRIRSLISTSHPSDAV